MGVGHAPAWLTVTPDGKTRFVASLGYYDPFSQHQNYPSSVTAIATATNIPGQPINVGKGAWGIVITP